MGAPFTVELCDAKGAAVKPPQTVDSLAEARGWINVAGADAVKCNVWRGPRLVARYRKVTQPTTGEARWVQTLPVSEDI